MKIENLNPIDAIQHWLITPCGSYFGYPNYGNKIAELLYNNRQDLQYVTNKVIDDILEDLGIEYAKEIASVNISTDKEKFYIIVALFDKNYATGIYNV